MEDISLRALRVLKEVDLIAAEDTRHALKLLNHYGIKKPLTSYHKYSSDNKACFIIEEILKGKNVALISDAGSPGISDPGEDIVKLAIKNNINITMIPGPVAAITGLVLSGFPASRFVFEGFLPYNKRLRKERILSFKNETRTIVLYEAPHKLLNTLRDLFNLIGERKVVLARELTKKFEDLIRCTLSEAIEKYETEAPIGEFVIILEGSSEEALLEEKRKRWDTLNIEEHVDFYLKQGKNKKEAIKNAASDRGIAAREVYNQLIKNKNLKN